MTPALHLARNRDLKTLIQVALGHQPADRVLVNTRLVNVYSGEILNNYSIGMVGEWIAWVAPSDQAPVEMARKIDDLAGQTVIPGLIEGHTHLLSAASISEYLRYLIPEGHTTIITETMEALPVLGLAGVHAWLDALSDQPITFLATAPVLVSTSPLAMPLTPSELEGLLARPDIVGLGETYWQGLFQEPGAQQILQQLIMTRQAGKCLEGHSAGAGGRKLLGYAASGISSCHEPISVDETLSRLRLGIYVMIREGSIRRDLEVIAHIMKHGEHSVDTRRLILSTDGISPRDVMEKGGLDYVVQKAIDCGFAPVAAIQMATLNVAEHFGLADVIGGIAPGRRADILIVPDEKTIKPREVICGGRTLAREGKLLVPPRQPVFPERVYNCYQLSRPLTATDFRLEAPPQVTVADVQVIELVTDLVTRPSTTSLPVTEGAILCDPERDIIKISALDRTRAPDIRFTGFLKGFGLQRGAVATTGSWDTANLVVAGADDTDMALAVNRVAELNGGMVVCEAGCIRAELALPVLGLVSELPLEVIASHNAAIQKAISDLGCSFRDPILTLQTLTGAAIPFIRICESGMVHLRDGRLYTTCLAV